MDAKILYTPILKGKANDLKALGRLPRPLASHLLPMVELLAPNQGETIDANCQRFSSQLRKYCPLQTVSLDLHSIAPADRMTDGSMALEAVCANLRGLRIPFVPVFGFDHEAELWDRIARVASRENRGLTFRLKLEDIEDSDSTTAEIIKRLAHANIAARATNLLIDLSTVAGMDPVDLVSRRELVQDFIDRASTVRDFALISVIGSSMPRDVTEVAKEGAKAYYRHELALWLEAAASLPSVELAFGDYGIIHPNFSDKNPATNANAKIRYTRGMHHHVFRGYSLSKGLKYHQYHDLSGRVIASSIYLGAAFSYGDDYLWRCARMEAGSGNLGTWVEVDVNHHLAYVGARLPQILARLSDGVPTNEVLATAA